MDCYNSVWDYRYRNKDFVKKTAELLTDIGEFSIWMPRKEHDDVKLYDISGYYTFELDGGLSITLEYYITRKDESHIAVHLYITNHEKAFRKEFFIALGDNPLKMSAKPIKESWGRYKYINALSLSDSDIHITEQRDTYQNNITEQQLEDIAVSALEKYKGPAFIMTSAMNVDRLKTAYNIAQRTGRLFLEDIYTASILTAVGKNVPAPVTTRGVKVFMVGGRDSHDALAPFTGHTIGRNSIAKSEFLMCIRPSMIRTLKKLNEDRSFENGILFYSMWKGYQENEYTKKFLEYMESTGVKIHALHTSGHADIETIDRLVEKASPETIIPVHTENPQWYEKYGIFTLISENSIEV